MMLFPPPPEIADVRRFLNAYNEAFYRKDLDKLRSLYSGDDIVFWDNHASCDSQSLDDHLSRVGHFFGTADVQPLGTEIVGVVGCGQMAVLTAVLRYKSRPEPGVRSTFVLVRSEEGWKACHVHHSFDPNETPEADPRNPSQ